VIFDTVHAINKALRTPPKRIQHSHRGPRTHRLSGDTVPGKPKLDRHILFPSDPRLRKPFHYRESITWLPSVAHI
jgi:hypothetical protein